MRIAGYSVDHKDEFEGEVIQRLLDEVGGQKCVYSYGEALMFCDDKLLYFSSEPLDNDQLKELWEQGDLAVVDEVWEGSFDEIVRQLVVRLEEES